MNNSNKHLDDLFAAARREEPIISEDNARDLLRENQHMQLPSKLISTKGAIMTSIGLSVAAVTAYVLLSGSPATNPSQTNPSQPQVANLLLHSNSSNTDEPKKSDGKVTKKMVIVKKGEDVPTHPTPPTPPIPPFIVTPVKVAGIIPMALPPEKFAQMGIAKKDDGTITFSQKNENGKIFTMGFPKNSWGIVMGSKIDETTISDPPAFAPLIVTDTKGNKRMMQFTHRENGMEWHNLQVQSHGESDRDVGSDSTFDPDAVMRGESKDIIGDGLKMIRHKVKTLNKESKVVMNVYMPNHNRPDSNIDREKHFAFDTTGKNFGERMEWIEDEMQIRIRRGDNEDSLANLGASIGEMLKNEVEKESKAFNMDSIYKAATKTMKKAEIEMKSINMDSIFKETNKSLKNANEEMKMLNLDSIFKSASESMIEAEKIMSKRSNELNHLVPILVRSATKDHYNKHADITYDDGLIFWYNNTEDFVKAAKSVPIVTSYIIADNADSVVINTPNGKKVITAAELSAGNPSPVSNQVVSKSLIYPNPAKNITTVRFTLSEPRTLAFSIHDLLGKRIKDAGSISESSAGTYEKELNISELTAGVYLLVITTDKGEQSMQRLVIEK